MHYNSYDNYWHTSLQYKHVEFATPIDSGLWPAQMKHAMGSEQFVFLRWQPFLTATILLGMESPIFSIGAERIEIYLAAMCGHVEFRSAPNVHGCGVIFDQRTFQPNVGRSCDPLIAKHNRMNLSLSFRCTLVGHSAYLNQWSLGSKIQRLWVRSQTDFFFFRVPGIIEQHIFFLLINIRDTVFIDDEEAKKKAKSIQGIFNAMKIIIHA